MRVPDNKNKKIALSRLKINSLLNIKCFIDYPFNIFNKICFKKMYFLSIKIILFWYIKCKALLPKYKTIF